jgi:hypothetical protein
LSQTIRSTVPYKLCTLHESVWSCLHVFLKLLFFSDFLHLDHALSDTGLYAVHHVIEWKFLFGFLTVLRFAWLIVFLSFCTLCPLYWLLVFI